MKHKLYKFIEVVENTQSYQTNLDFQKDFQGYVDKFSSEDVVEDTLFIKLKDEVNKNYPIIYQTEILPDVRLFESIEEEEEETVEEPVEEPIEDVDIDDPDAEEKASLALIEEPVAEEAPLDSDIPPAPAVSAGLEPIGGITAPEEGSDIDPDKKSLTSSQIVQKKEFEENLDQIEKNLFKIKELDSNDELNDLFLKELGKKYVIEQELMKLGTDDEFSVENSIDSIFESKQLNPDKYSINYNKTLSNFKNKFTKLNEAKTLFTQIVKDKVITKLNENLEVVFDESGKQFSIYKLDGLDDRLCLKTNFELPENFSELLSKEDGFYTFDINDLVDLVSEIKQYSHLEASDKFVLEIDGSFVSMDDDSLDLVDDVDDTDTKYDTWEEADKVASSLFESTMTRFNVKRIAPTQVGSVVVDSVLYDNKFFKLNENYVVKGEIVARKGYPVALLERKGEVNKFSTINSSNKNVTLFEENMLFEASLEPITELEYDSLKTDVILEDTVLEELRALCESKGKKLTFKRGVIGRKLYESAFIDEHNVISKEIGEVDEFGKVENYGENSDMTDDDSINFILENEEDVVDALKTQIESEVEIPTVEIQGLPDSDISNNLSDGQELKISTNVYQDINGNVTNFSNGGENNLLFARNAVVKYYGEKGVTADDGETWANVPSEYLIPFEKFDVTSLVAGNNYTITDLENSVNAEFVGTHDVEDVLLYEFMDILNNESLYLREEEVGNNVK